jgi:hypothetical protein
MVCKLCDRAISSFSDKSSECNARAQGRAAYGVPPVAPGWASRARALRCECKARISNKHFSFASACALVGRFLTAASARRRGVIETDSESSRNGAAQRNSMRKFTPILGSTRLGARGSALVGSASNLLTAKKTASIVPEGGAGDGRGSSEMPTLSE